MTKEETQNLKEKLEKERKIIEQELSRFAERDKKLKGDWDTKYPEFQSGASGSQLEEEAADEVEEYITLLPIEHSLELRLLEINKAIEKMKKGTYGKCEKCKKEIESDRLKFFPEASLCSKCQNNR